MLVSAPSRIGIALPFGRGARPRDGNSIRECLSIPVTCSYCRSVRQATTTYGKDKHLSLGSWLCHKRIPMLAPANYTENNKSSLLNEARGRDNLT